MSNSPFENKSISKTYFQFSLPVVFGMVITILYNITDTYFIAKTGNTSLVAGVSLCAPIFTLLMAFGNIYGQGGSSLISRLLGENKSKELHSVSSFCFYAAIITGALFGLIMLLFRKQFLVLLGSDEETLPYAMSYYCWMAIGAPFVVMTFIHTNLLRAEGMAKESMIASAGGSFVNIIMDPILIFTLNMGVAGAAIATLLGYIFTDMFALRIVLKKSKALSVNPQISRIDREKIGQIFGIGIAAALSNIMSSFCTVILNQSLLFYGNDKIAAMGIAQKISMIVMLAITGFSFGGAPLIGYYYGKKDDVSLKKLLSFVFRFLWTLAIAMSVVLIIAAPTAVRLFLQDEVLKPICVTMLRTQLAGMVFMATVLVIQIIFQATGKTKPALVLSISRQGFVYVIVFFVALKVAGYNGIIYTQLISDVLSALLAGVLLRKMVMNDPVLKM